MFYTRVDNNGKISINSMATFQKVAEDLPVADLNNFNDFFAAGEALIRAKNPAVSQQALSNVRGAWYEWIIAHTAYKFFIAENAGSVLVKLPNVNQFDCAQLFQDKTYNLIADLRHKVQQAGVSLITSNPDFCLISRHVFDRINFNYRQEITVDFLDGLYRDIIGQCELNDVRGYAAVKTSFRPDRRLQIPHEGSLMKALYRHIQTRDWIIDAPGINYYAFTQSFTDADANALKTVATHSITDVMAKPSSAVDALFAVNSSENLRNALQRICI